MHRFVGCIDCDDGCCAVSQVPGCVPKGGLPWRGGGLWVPVCCRENPMVFFFVAFSSASPAPSCNIRILLSSAASLRPLTATSTAGLLPVTCPTRRLVSNQNVSPAYDNSSATVSGTMFRASRDPAHSKQKCAYVSFALASHRIHSSPNLPPILSNRVSVSVSGSPAVLASSRVDERMRDK